MADTSQTTGPQISGKTVALVVYGLYFAAYLNGITGLIGVVIAHLQEAGAPSLLQSHYRFQLRTFWFGLVCASIGVGILLAAMVSSMIGAGIGIIGGVVAIWMLWWFVWSLIRNVKGMLALIHNKPIENPDPWMFG